MSSISAAARCVGCRLRSVHWEHRFECWSAAPARKAPAGRLLCTPCCNRLPMILWWNRAFKWGCKCITMSAASAHGLFGASIPKSLRAKFSLRSGIWGWRMVDKAPMRWTKEMHGMISSSCCAATHVDMTAAMHFAARRLTPSPELLAPTLIPERSKPETLRLRHARTPSTPERLKTDCASSQIAPAMRRPLLVGSKRTAT